MRRYLKIITGGLIISGALLFTGCSGSDRTGNIDFIQNFSDTGFNISVNSDELKSMYNSPFGMRLGKGLLKQLTLAMGEPVKIALPGKPNGSSEGELKDFILRISYDDFKIGNREISIKFREHDGSYYRLELKPQSGGQINLFRYDDKMTRLEFSTTQSSRAFIDGISDKWLHVVVREDKLLILDSDTLLMYYNGLSNHDSSIVDVNIEPVPGDTDNTFVSLMPLVSAADNFVEINGILNHIAGLIENPERNWNVYYPEHLVKIDGIPELDFIQRVRLSSSSKRTLLMPIDSSMQWAGVLPDSSRLDFSINLINKYIYHPDRISFRVTLEGNYRKRVFDTTVSFENFINQTWQDVSIPLEDFSGRFCRITLEPHIKGETYPYDNNIVTLWGNPIVKGARDEDDYNVILISLDTLRADHVHCYGYERDTTPNIDRYAKKGILFEETVASSSWTLPSHMSMFTGLYPTEVGAESEFKDERDIQRSTLVPEVFTIGEYLKSAGYTTHAEVGGGFVSAFYNEDQGFETFNENRLGPWERDIALEIPKAVEWIRKNRENKFFLLFHTFEIHHIYLRRYFKAENPDDLKEQIIANYDSGIRYADKYLAYLFKALEEEGIADKTLVVVTSDHGENFEFINPEEKILEGLHGRTLKDVELMVPLIMWGPDEFNRGVRIKRQVRSIDIVPTILDILSIEPVAPLRGQSLLEIVDESRGSSRVAYSESIRIWQTPPFDERALRTGEHKLLERVPVGHGVSGQDSDLFKLYDLKSDPAETRDISHNEYDVFEKLRVFMKKTVESIQERKKRLTKNAGRTTMSDETREALERLGYIDVHSEQPKPEDNDKRRKNNKKSNK